MADKRPMRIKGAEAGPKRPRRLSVSAAETLARREPIAAELETCRPGEINAGEVCSCPVAKARLQGRVSTGIDAGVVQGRAVDPLRPATTGRGRSGGAAAPVGEGPDHGLPTTCTRKR